MQPGQPSRTAFAAAVYRAAHQVLEQGRIFSDPLALPITGLTASELAQEEQTLPSRRAMRIFIAVRTRFAEDALARAVECGVRQLVILGAGLDTYAYRSPFRERLRIFEVDHPATQAWKRARLKAAGMSIPDSLTFAAVNFETETLADALNGAGFDHRRPSFFTWLGVVPYLAEEAAWATLRIIAQLPGGAHVVFDYSDPPESLPPEARLVHEERAARVAGAGEAFKTYFDARRLEDGLRAIGFSRFEDLGPPQIIARYVPSYSGSPPEKGAHIIHAATVE